MVSPIQGRSVLDINAAAEEHSSIVQDLLAAHGLTGCDRVAAYFGVGKVAALKVLRHGQCKWCYDFPGVGLRNVGWASIAVWRLQLLLYVWSSHLL